MKKIVCIIAALLMGCFVLTACESEGSSPNTNEPTEFSLWSKESTANVMQDVAYDEAFKGAAEYKISGGRGEYEAAQLILPAP